MVIIRTESVKQPNLSLRFLQVLFNYEWIHTKLSAMPMVHLIGDYDLHSDPEVNLVKAALQQIQIEFDPDIVGIELAGRYGSIEVKD